MQNYGILRKQPVLNVDFYTKQLCDHLRLSPQTLKQITIICHKIARRESLNTDEQNFTYNKEKEIDNKRQILSHVPQLLQDICLSCIINKNSIVHKHNVEGIIKRLYNGYELSSLIRDVKEISKDAFLSPQTRSALVAACKNNNKEDPRLSSYDPAIEKRKTIDLIERMPPILRDICLKNIQEDSTYALIHMIYKSKNSEKRGDFIYHISQLVKYKYLSPQAIVTIMEEFGQLLKEGSVLYRSCNDYNEENNKRYFIKKFPFGLYKVFVEQTYKDPRDYITQFYYYAYLLENPHNFQFFKSLMSVMPIREAEWIKHHKSYIKDSMPAKINDKKATIKQLTNQFIATFDKDNKTTNARVKVYINEQYDVQCDRICAPNTSNKRKALKNQLIANRDKLLADVDTTTSQELNIQGKKAYIAYINQKLCENLEPSCPVCLEVFADYMQPLECYPVGVTIRLDCKHALCSNCFSQLQTPVCPLCRQPIVSDI
jgi:hypothetical protein